MQYKGKCQTTLKKITQIITKQRNKNFNSVIRLMFEITNTALLPEILLEINRAKNCRKFSFRKKHYERHIQAACMEQNEIRSHLKKILPKETKTIEDPNYGVDYLFNNTTIDQKFSFGALGEDTIKIRVRERRLLNKSNWTMIINKKHEAEFFETKKLALFVKKNWGIVQKRLVGKKDTYSEYAISLYDFFRTEKVKPITAELSEEEILRALLEISAQTKKEIVEEILTKNQILIDDTKKICFEPILASIALEILA